MGKDKRAENYLREPYARILVPDKDGTFSAEILEFPGCFSQGNSPEEAFRNLEEAAQNWIRAALAQEQEIPPPFANQGYGGKIALRLPKSIHRQAARMAERDGASLNQFLLSAIAVRIGAEGLLSNLAEKLALPFLCVHNTQNNMNIIIIPKGSESQYVELPPGTITTLGTSRIQPDQSKLSPIPASIEDKRATEKKEEIFHGRS